MKFSVHTLNRHIEHGTKFPVSVKHTVNSFLGTEYIWYAETVEHCFLFIAGRRDHRGIRCGWETLLVDLVAYCYIATQHGLSFLWMSSGKYPTYLIILVCDL